MHMQIGPNLFRAGVPTQDFEYYAAPQQIGRQRQSMWCWAASIQMVLNYHGLYVNQEQIVQRIFGLLYNAPAGLDHMLAALSGWAYDNRGSRSEIHATTYGLTSEQLINDLSMNWPLIVGFRGYPMGHSCVLPSIEYTKLFNGMPILTKAIYRDPWPGNSSKQETSWFNFYLWTSFLVRVWVTRL